MKKKRIISLIIALALAVGMGAGLGYIAPGKVAYSEYEGEAWMMGFGKEEVTPDDWQEKEYYIAGFMHLPYNPMKGNLDGMFVRAVGINDGTDRGTTVLAVIDCVGIAYEDVLDIRSRLKDLSEEYNIQTINIYATHTHHCLDTQGLWGNILAFKSGMIPEFMEKVKTKTVEAVTTAVKSMQEGDLYYTRVEKPEYFRDSREPQVMDPSINRFRFVPKKGGRETYIVNLAAHPETLGQGAEYRNFLSSDYPYYLEKRLNESNVDCLFINGALGGLIGYRAVRDSDRPTRMKDFGVQVAELLLNMENGQKVKSTLDIYTGIVRVPITNNVFAMAFKKGLTSNKAIVVEGKDYEYDYDTEVCYMVFGGNIKVASLPGEIFPELIIGGMVSAEESVSGLESAITPFNELVGENDYALCFGLSNDAIGYVIPENDFLEVDKDLFALLQDSDHYEELICLGRQTGVLLMEKLQELVNSADNG